MSERKTRYVTANQAQRFADKLMQTKMRRKTKRRKRTNYARGAEVERFLVNGARGKHQLAFRSAGSHSSIDVFILDEHEETVDLIQCKRSKDGRFPKVDAPFREGYYFVRFKQMNWKDGEGLVNEQVN